MHLSVDGKAITARPGQSLLAACLENGIYIPHLCFAEEDDHSPASCRLCFVQVGGSTEPQTACTLKVSEGLVVRTDAPEVRRLQQSALRLLLSSHRVDCRNCPANRACVLQKIAAFLGIGLKASPLDRIPVAEQIDRSHPAIDHFPHRCVLCGKCIRACENRNGLPMLTFAGRGFDTAVRYYPLSDQPPGECEACGRCIAVCPVGALVLRS
jgi:NADH dehydrogenase/NADH:ubiquinone oxidoreductase subunit G